MKLVRRFLTLLIFAIAAITINSCDPLIIADVVITYEVTVTNSSRDYYVTYSNATNGEDAFNNLTDLTFTESISIPSDLEPSDYFLFVECDSDLRNNTSQSITLRIYEDDQLMDEVTTAGTAYLDESVSAYLPTGIKYE